MRLTPWAPYLPRKDRDAGAAANAAATAPEAAALRSQGGVATPTTADTDTDVDVDVDVASTAHAQAVAAALRTLPGRRVAVVGMGVSGVAMARLLAAHGADLVLVDSRPALASSLTAAFPRAELRLGPQTATTLHDCPTLALSPGIDPNGMMVAAALHAGALVFGELALVALRPQPAQTVAITGTNGKSTTTALCGALVHGCGAAAFVGGNLGEPVADWVRTAPTGARAVLELSSYQIDGATGYVPDVAVMLNLTPDHLPRYGDVATYGRSKARLLAALPQDGIAVLNADDAAVRAMADHVRGQVLWFGLQGPLPGPGLWLNSADAQMAMQVQVQDAGKVPFDLSPAQTSLAHPTLLGPHNCSNVLAARLAALALLYRAPPTPAERAGAPDVANHLAQAYANFAGLPHRLAPVGKLGGGRWLNDSKATNDASVATAVAAMARPYILLVGGLDDGAPFVALPAALRQRPPVAAFAFGQAGARLAATVTAAVPSRCPVKVVPELAQACAGALGALASRPAGTDVLLSPGCKSFDAFADYRHRGDVFAAWVATAQAAVGD